MKNLYLILIATSALFLTVACNKENEIISENDVEIEKSINFEVAGMFTTSGVNSKAYTPSYEGNNLQIYAYKLDESSGDYFYSKTLSLSNINYIPVTKTWKGNVVLEVGTYKFLPTYGFRANNNITLSSLENQSLNTISEFTYTPSSTDAFPEIFLPLRTAEEIKSYNISALHTYNDTVRDTISRAVSRVDVMFIKARKEGDTYIEESYSEGLDIFGQMNLGKMEFRFVDISNKMNLLGESQAGLTNAVINAPYTTQGGVTIGTNNSGTIIGNEDYFRFDSIQTNDIIKGSAHVFGSYLLPDFNVPTSKLQLYVEPLNKKGQWTSRTIDIIPYGEYDRIPFEQNKVTLIKVYVLRDDHLFGVDPGTPDPDPDPDDEDPDPDPIIPSASDFGVEIEVLVIDEWDESNQIDYTIGEEE